MELFAAFLLISFPSPVTVIAIFLAIFGEWWQAAFVTVLAGYFAWCAVDVQRRTA